MDKLTTFQYNDSEKLLKLAKKLNQSKFFEGFLNDSQYKFLSHLIDLDNTEIWSNFLQCNCYLKLVPTNEEEDSEPNPDMELDIEEGVKTVNWLALHVRYLLWEKAIDFYFSSKDIDESKESINEVTDDYELIDSIDTMNDSSAANDSNPTDAPVAPAREEDDDYDFDEDDANDNSVESPSLVDSKLKFNDDKQLILEVPMTLFQPKEETPATDDNETNQEEQEKMMKKFNKIYHNFEFDRDTLIKRRRLEKSDLKLEKTNDQDSTSLHQPLNPNVDFTLGASSSLKHLLNTIQQNRDQIQLNDYELRTLFMDVKKNRGKWANDERVGQEELYEACEKVVMELRSYTEHSTPFLNKVSKREAPNYGLIIKKPMDLNTVMKKLKNLQYESKQEFIDDIMLIWSNCLSYNSDPKHFLRTHAYAMQKKSLKLFPHIPNITIKNRSEVEKEDEPDVSTNDNSGKGKSSKKGRKRTREEKIKVEEESTFNSPDSSVVDTPVEEVGSDTPAAVTATQTPAPSMTQDGSPTAMNDEEEEEEEADDMHDNNAQNDEDESSPLTQAWRTLTAKSRAHYCSQRAELFDEYDSYKLNPNAPGIIREQFEMSNFKHYLTNDQVVSKGPSLLENDEPYLLEYDITGGIPGIKFTGIDDSEQEKEEQRIVDTYLNKHIEQEKSKFWLDTDKGLNKIYFDNINEMQEIRKICFKISLIRQMQTQQFVHHTQMKQPEIERIEETDLDPISRLSNHEPFYRDVQFSVLRKNVSKIVMQTGFELAEPSAINTLAQIAEKYISNLAKSIKLHAESTSKNRLSTREVLLVSLVENGVNKPDDLYTYVSEKILNQQTKLKDLRRKLSNFLKDLLRPGLENFNEKSFKDDSEQFMTGDFSNDLGDDFFGFKELGLDKEYNLLSSSIPVYLLHSRLHNSFTSTGSVSKGNKYADLRDYKVNKLHGNEVDRQIGLLTSFYHKFLEKTTTHYIKQQKKKGESLELPEMSKLPLIDDEELPQKQRNIRPRLPPTGKIASTKKKVIGHSYFIPEEDDASPQKSEEQSTLDNNDNGLDSKAFDNPFNLDSQADLDNDIDDKGIELMMSDME